MLWPVIAVSSLVGCLTLAAATGLILHRMYLASVAVDEGRISAARRLLGGRP